MRQRSAFAAVHWPLTKTTTAASTKRKKRNSLLVTLFLYENKLKLVIVAALIREGCASLHKCSLGLGMERSWADFYALVTVGREGLC